MAEGGKEMCNKKNNKKNQGNILDDGAGADWKRNGGAPHHWLQECYCYFFISRIKAVHSAHLTNMELWAPPGRDD